MKVLIVDDNEQARRMMKHYLGEQTHEFLECEDGSEALAAYAEFQPDWVLMDWDMKELGGLAATRNIIAYFPDAKILIVTNYDEKDLRQAATQAGAIGFVPKDDLVAVRSFLQSR